MDNKSLTIGVLTSGGDAPGMNAALRAIVRTADNEGLRVLGIKRGYSGIFRKEYEELTPESVRGTIQKGGTYLLTARCREMLEADGPKEAAWNLREMGIDVLITIGGDGTFRGALDISEQGIPVIAVPATIDLDLGCTEYTIGFDTAVNTAIEAIDKIRDSSSAHERISIIEVMGRHAGHIALWSAIGSGADEALLPETYDYNDGAVIERISQRARSGKRLNIIINAEGVGNSDALARRIEQATGIETRASNLGYMQRGGNPTARDRVTGSNMGAQAVRAICEGRFNRAVVEKYGMIQDIDLAEAIGIHKELPGDLVDLSRDLIR